ncbi:sigma factor-like helix-turn-helix DNA-binding protein [Ammonicoccus fulvus]|uniref:Sigma factor-like helix-turn-helix DNA-binding protein n=1 Tax=Ammonicoccus fulvus TaxID=3138240 RepID=A0ABZ3FQX8_9ACTN
MTQVMIPAEALLTADEETELARSIEAGILAADLLAHRSTFCDATTTELELIVAGGQEARDRYVLANVRLVTMVANRAARRTGLSAHELFSEGMSGLIQAVDRFDYTHEVRFATYALPWIRATVARATATRCGALPVSAARAERRRLVRSVRQRLMAARGREVTAQEIADELELSVEVVEEMLAMEPPTALHDDRGFSIDLPDPGATEALEAVLGSVVPLADWVRRLPADERGVITRRFGFSGEPLSLVAVGRELGMSASSVRRLELRALGRLRAWYEAENLLLAG